MSFPQVIERDPASRVSKVIHIYFYDANYILLWYNKNVNIKVIIMDENTGKIIVSIIGLIGTIIGSLFTYLVKSKNQAIKEAEREQAQRDQIEAVLKEQQKIKERLDKHNGYAEKFAENSKSLAVLAVEQKNIICSLDKLQKNVDYLKSDRCKV